MHSTGTISCPVAGCSFEGTLSRTIYHITEQDDERHTWDALGYQHSWGFRRTHTNGSNENRSSTAASKGSAKQDGSKADLEDIPGIGNKRAATLRKAGYKQPEDVAKASIGELSEVRLLSNSSARCIQTTAQEECGYPDTVISQMADSFGENREAVFEAYAGLAGVSVPPDKAKQALQLLFDPAADRTIMQLSEYAVRYRYFLFQEGLEKISDVAEASIEQLTEASYIGDFLAENMREKAIEMQSRDSDSSSNESTTRNSTEQINSTEEQTTSKKAPDSKADSWTNDPATVGIFPEQMKNLDQWLLWKNTDDGRKIPRAPWETGDPLRYVDAMDPSNWVSFDEAQHWQSKLPQNFKLAYALTRNDEIVFLDLDDVIIDGEPSPAAQKIIEEANSYTAISTSGTGIHIFINGSLDEEIKSLTGPIGEGSDQSLEVYDRKRFVAVTGDHLEGTPTEVTSGDPFLSELENEYASVSIGKPDQTISEPKRTRDELSEIEKTSDIEDVFDAISQTRPSDIRMRSTQTREHGDGTYSYDPSWVHSESGTRLGVLDDVWIYRKGMMALDALQLVALEERIISDEREYPKGSDFWKAVDALRDRGAHIPKFEPSEEPVSDITETDFEAEINKWEVGKRINYGERVRVYVHPYDRNYQEKLALELTPILIDAAESLYISPAVVYRAAELYAKGHAAGIVPGAAHESSLGAALRIAAIEAGTPRPLADIADVFESSQTSIRNKFQRMMKETNLSETVDIRDLIIDPVDYVPYIARHLEVTDDNTLRDSVCDLLAQEEHGGGTNPISEVAGAFYAAMKHSDNYSITQEDVSRATGVSKVTIRNNYRKYDSPR